MGSSEHEDTHKGRLRGPGWNLLSKSALGVGIQVVLLFAAAGRADLPRLWLLAGMTFAWVAINAVCVAVANPELLNQRGLWRRKTDTKPWDRKLLKLYGVLGFYLMPLVISLDLGRRHWSSLGPWSIVVGTAMSSLGLLLVTWAMLVNPHFEVTVRIQADRDHKVVAAGPYAMVRHPGYLGAILWLLSSPLIAGSVLGMVPGGLAGFVFLLRAAREDRALQAELPGYADYARRVRFRLLPGIW